MLSVVTILPIMRAIPIIMNALNVSNDSDVRVVPITHVVVNMMIVSMILSALVVFIMIGYLIMMIVTVVTIMTIVTIMMVRVRGLILTDAPRGSGKASQAVVILIA